MFEVITFLTAICLVYKKNPLFFKNIQFPKFKYTYFFISSFIFRFISIILFKFSFFYPSLNIISQLSMLIFIFLNMKKIKGLIYLFIGTLFNTIAIIFNNGKMPVDATHMLHIESNMYELLKNDDLVFHNLLTEKTLFPYFSDIIPLVKPSFYPIVFSIGDIFIWIGIFLTTYIFFTSE